MAHPVEPMDIDSDFDNKENSFRHNNVLPCTEKGYEELDVSELNMKLRYSVTPAASPMSKSFTHCTDNRNLDSDVSLNYGINETNLTRSLNSTMTTNDNVIKSLKSLPLQCLSTDVDSNRSTVLRQLDSTVVPDSNNITVTISGTNDIDENISLPSSSSSLVHTPEATTPTKEIPKNDGGSPIMRGLKSVLNMFRSSQSPIPPAEGDDYALKHEVLSPADVSSPKTEDNSDMRQQPVLASTPIAAHKNKEGNGSKRNSPYKESIVFNDDLEKELQWKDETTIIFSQEKIPIHKLFFQQTKPIPKIETDLKNEGKKHEENNFNSTVEYMDVSYNDSALGDKTITQENEINKSELHIANESDSEFLDCETTFTKNESIITDNHKPEINTGQSISDNNLNTNGQTNEVVMEINQETIDIYQESPKEKPVESQNIDSVCLDIKKTEPSLQNTENTIVDASSHVNNIEQINSTISIKCNTNNLVLDSTYISNPEVKSMEEKSSPLLMTVISKENIDNTKIQEKSNIETNAKYNQNSEDNAKSNIAVDYELDSLEHNVNSTASATTSIIYPNGTSEPQQFTKSLGNNARTDVTRIELPIDIPLPDEDDFDREVNISTPDLVENIHISKSEIVALVDKVPNETTSECDSYQMTGIDKEMLLQGLPFKNTLKEDNTFAILNQDDADLSKVINDIENLLASDENNLHNNTEQIDNYLQSLDINDLQALPDLVNQTMTLSNKDNVDNIQLPKCLDIKSVSETEIKTNNILTTLEAIQTIKDDNTVQIESLQPQLIQDSEEKININICESTSCEDIPMTAEHNLQQVNQLKLLENTHQIDFSQINPNEISQSKILDLAHHISDSQIQPNVINDGLKCPDDVTITSDRKHQEMNLPNSLENIQLISNSQGEQIKTPTVITNDDSVDAETGLPAKLHPIQNMFSSQIEQTIETGIENIQKIPVPITYVNNKIPATVLSESSTNNLNSENKINDVVHELTEVTLTPEKDAVNVLKDFVESNAPEETRVHSRTVECEVQEQNLEKLINCSSNTSITQYEIKEEYPLNLENFATFTNKMQLENLILQHEIKPERHETIKDLVCDDNLPNQLFKELEISENTKCDSLREEKILDNLNSDDCNIETIDLGITDDEVVVSENNSPYVSVAADLNIITKSESIENLPDIENPFDTRTNIPSSPPIASKGYNFNFDEVDDPFATKTQIRMSPAPETTNDYVESTVEQKNNEMHKKERNKNKRKSLPERKKPKPKNQLHTSLHETVPDTTPKKLELVLPENVKLNTETEEVAELQIEPHHSEALKNQSVSSNMTRNSDTYDNKLEKTRVTEMVTSAATYLRETISVEESKLPQDTVTTSSNEIKNNSSSELSSYYSAGASSNENIKSRNVFNLPEIDDINFNPFATKSKMRQSPTLGYEADDPFVTRNKITSSPESSKIFINNTETTVLNDTMNLGEIKLASSHKDTEDKMETEAMEKNVTANISNTFEISNNEDDTVREVHTEDEDTIEGPFLEAEDLNNVDKMSDCTENADMMQFNDIPVSENDNAEGELFIDAEAFEFLLNQNKSNTVADSGKESLFLKFDPLFAKRISSDTVAAALSRVQKRHSTPRKVSTPKKDASVSVAGPSTLNVTYETDLNNTTEGATEDLNVTVTKPMMVVTPAVNSTAMPRKSLTPTRSNRRSFTFTSPAMAVIDRLLSLSANNSFAEHESTVTFVSREQNEADLALTQLREVLAEKEIGVFNLRSESKELKDRLSTLESQVNNLEAIGLERLSKINELNEKLSEKTKMNKSMAAVVEEYERTIASLIAETEQDKKRHAEERVALINERDEQTAHLASMEVAFNDLHSKYEKSKQVILSYKANEEKYKKSLDDFEKSVTKMQNNYEFLKQHATSKLNHANEELQKMNKSHEAEILKMNAMIKRKDLHITSLEETLSQKTKANEELTAICDELINKVG